MWGSCSIACPDSAGPRGAQKPHLHMAPGGAGAVGPRIHTEDDGGEENRGWGALRALPLPSGVGEMVAGRIWLARLREEVFQEEEQCLWSPRGARKLCDLERAAWSVAGGWIGVEAALDSGC